jgi:helicase MOV-10
VAITRAQALLIVVGDPDLLGRDELWRTFLNYMVLGGGLRGKEPSWNSEHKVPVPRYSIIPRKGGPIFGEGLIGGKSESVFRYREN